MSMMRTGAAVAMCDGAAAAATSAATSGPVTRELFSSYITALAGVRAEENCMRERDFLKSRSPEYKSLWPRLKEAPLGGGVLAWTRGCRAHRVGDLRRPAPSPYQPVAEDGEYRRDDA